MSKNLTQTKQNRLTPGQSRAIPFILSSPSLEIAAKKSKVSRDTISRWLRKPHFKERLDAKREELFHIAMERLKILSDKAILKLGSLIDSKHEGIARLASKDILHYSFKATETQDILDRIERLEEIIEKRYVS